MKQSYVPPHKRNQRFEKENQKYNENPTGKVDNFSNSSNKKQFIKRLDMNDINQFPDLENNNLNPIILGNNNIITINPKNNKEINKPTLSSIFKQSLLNKKKQKKQKLKKGWIHLTK